MDVINQIIHKLCGIVAFCIWFLVGMVVLAMYLAGPPDEDFSETGRFTPPALETGRLTPAAPLFLF